MFTADSRYRNVPDITAPDPNGRVLVAKDIRPLPVIIATFRHVVTHNDRLDEVATRYYGRPPLWWQVCDANPEVLSPLDLLSGGPVRVTEIPLTLPSGHAGAPPWAQLTRALLAVTGVEAVRIRDEVELVPEPRTQGGRSVLVVLERPLRAVLVTHSLVAAPPASLVTAVRTTPFLPGPVAEVERVGQEILIPPLAIG
jgi:hypothetical protein